MSQRQYTTYQADILSFELRDALIGILNPGRYYGFNAMTEYQAQSGNNVYCRVSGGGIAKYDKTYPTPVIEANRGILISTQGQIITEDGDIDFTIVVSAPTGIKWHILYFEHAYYPSVPGANNATYGVKAGSDGGGIPTLDYPTKQVPIGYIEEVPGANDFADLIYYKANVSQNYGDQNIAAKLWGSGTAVKFLDETVDGAVGTIPADGAIGDRQFSEQNFITNLQSISDSLDALDQIAKDNEDDIIILQATKLDDWGVPDDNTDLDATDTRHGLLPKLSNIASEFLNGEGDWATPLGKRLYWRDTPIISDFDMSDFGSFASSTGYLDLSAIVPSDCEIAWLRIVLASQYTIATDKVILGFKKDVTVGGSVNIELAASGVNEGTNAFESSIIGLKTNKTLYWFVVAGTPATHLVTISVTVLAWQTTV